MATYPSICRRRSDYIRLRIGAADDDKDAGVPHTDLDVTEWSEPPSWWFQYSLCPTLPLHIGLLYDEDDFCLISA